MLTVPMDQESGESTTMPLFRISGATHSWKNIDTRGDLRAGNWNHLKICSLICLTPRLEGLKAWSF